MINALRFKLTNTLKDIPYNFLKRRGVKHIIVQTPRGELMLDTSDIGLSKQLFYSTDKVWEPIATNYLLENVGGGVFVDVGANIGFYTVMLSGLFDETIAFEPCKKSFDLLQKNAWVLNNLPNVTLHKAAISDSFKTVCMGDNKIRNNARISSEGENVDAFPLDCFEWSDRISLLKMDVEGHEYEILVGNQAHLQDHPPKKIFLELHPDILGVRDACRVLGLLDELGYECEALFVTPKINDWFARLDRFFGIKWGVFFKNSPIRDLLDGGVCSGRFGSPQILFRLIEGKQ